MGKREIIVAARIKFKWRFLSAAAQAMEIPSGVESTCSHLLFMPRSVTVFGVYNHAI
jgi:hypothetical protein